MSIKNLYNDVCTVKSIAPASQNDMGEIIRPLTDKYVDIPCRITELRLGDREFVQGDGEFVSISYRIYTDPSYDIERNDIITFWDKTVRVVLDRKDSSKHHYELECKEITG